MVCGQMQQCLGKTADYYLTYHALSHWRLICEQEGEEIRIEKKNVQWRLCSSLESRDFGLSQSV